MTTVQLARMTAAAPAGAGPGWLRLYKRVFSDSPEHSLRLRLIAVTMFCWSAVALALVGSSSIVPLAVVPATLLGHLVAYRNWRRRMPFLALIVALVIMGVGIAMRFELVLAMRGERIPMAHFLLIAGAAASFEARTRGGLYTQVIFSAIVMFFSAELAFGNEFSLLLGGYLGLAIAFLATAYFVDQARDASVQWFKSRVSGVIFWVQVGVLVGACSAIAFLVLPWDNSQTPEGAQFAILPVTGGAGQVSEQSMTAEQMRAIAENSASAAAPQPINVPGSGIEAGADVGPGVNAIVGVAGSSPGQTVAADDAVAYVRSAVASYWRDGVYDSFVPDSEGGGRWVDTLDVRDKYSSIFSRPENGLDDSGRYLQTFFAQADLGSQFITGYNPTGIAVPRDRLGRARVDAGATYQAVSESPEIDPGTLRSDRAGWESVDYSFLPEELALLAPLAQALTAGAETDFDRAAAIAGYLHGLEYDSESLPLDQSGSILDFVLGERPGTSMDYATAMTMMARASGLQSRVATGFLPGRFNPYSGASEVTGKDAHAWTEVLFEEAGWVPFEAAPRPDLPSPASIKESTRGGLSTLLNNRIGDDIARAAGGAPGTLKSIFEWLTRMWPVSLVFMALSVLAGAVWWYRLSRGREPGGLRFAYSGLSGDGRKQALAAFARAEQSLSRRGFRRRKDSEPYESYARLAATYAGAGAGPLIALATVASRAAYSEQQFDESAAEEARSAAKDLRILLRG